MNQDASARLNLIRRPRRHGLWAAILFAAGILAVPAAQGFQIAGLQGSSPAQQLTELIQKRVQEFYSLLQSQQISRAEQYTTKESRDRLRDQVSNPFMGFRILSVTLAPDAQSATAVVELTVMAAFTNGPVPIERTSQWKIEDGEWRVEVPVPPPLNPQDKLPLGAGQSQQPEELKFEGHAFGLGVMKPGEVKDAHFPFENVTDHVVKIKAIAFACKCLTNKTEKMEYQPGEKGEVVIAFDSTSYAYTYSDTVVVTTTPGNVKSYLRIGADVIPPEIAFPEKPPAATQQ